jgi:N-acylmannosamine kinase
MIIAIDVGGTKISAALMENNEIIEQRKIDSVIHTDLLSLAQNLFLLCHGWADKADKVAVACTGQVGDEFVNFLSAKQKLPLKKQLAAVFNLPVTIINDAASAAWAEYCFTKGHLAMTNETLVYITVSTGIGGGMIQNGQLVTSNDGFCAHLGHTSVQHPRQQSIHCHCGRINCVEAISSGTAIAKQASIILNKTVSCKEVFEQYLEDTEIAQLIQQCSSAITDLIANVKATTGTEKIILGGSVGSSVYFFQQVQDKVAQLPEIYQVTIQAPACGADADLFGAYLYAQQQNTSTLSR